MISTEAWVIHQGPANGNGRKPEPAELRKEEFSFPDLNDDEVLVEPLYGCWEGNMSHAIERQPVDICQQRGEERCVVGNSGVVRVVQPGKGVKSVKEGDVCLFIGTSVVDSFGFMKKAFAYDAPNTVGMLAKRTKGLERFLVPIPENSKYTLQQWAAFSLRYVTAWANWVKAYGCYRVLLSEEEYPSPFVWGWGGGVTLAELDLANRFGCQTAMIASTDERLAYISKHGIRPIDRRQFSHLSFNEKKYQADAEYREAYKKSEDAFMHLVNEHTRGMGVSIFMDYIGLPVVRATLKALACPGVITTAGWKEGMKISHYRAMECMSWHVHVHTHYGRDEDVRNAVKFAVEHDWMPTLDEKVYDWDEVPELAYGHLEGRIDSYFPIYKVN